MLNKFKWGAIAGSGILGLGLMIGCNSNPPSAKPTPQPPATINWIKCADESSGDCSYAPRFTGLREMRFGSRISNKWV